MVRLSSIVGALAVSIATVRAAPHLSARQNLPDPSGQKNLGNGQGIQFIGGQCSGVADCASQCCATLPKGGQTIGVCSGPGAQFQAGKQGCGFESGGGAGNAVNNSSGQEKGANASNGGQAAAPPTGITIQPSTLKPDPNGAKNVGNGQGGQFITGECTSNADCASACCATVNTGTDFFGICSGPLANFQNGKQGCGFQSSGGAGNTGGNTPDITNGNANDAPLTVVPITPPGTTVKPSTLVPDPAGAKNVGNGVGAQFITGGCASDSDCASKCCALVNTGAETFGICSGPGANTQNGKQGCGFPVGGGQLSSF